MNDDAELLRRYADDGSQPAFAELVQRHLDLVYAAALRRTGDTHRAADIAQQVFTTVARDARKLSRHPAFVAWLHTATRNTAVNLMISEQRRLERETSALALESALGRADPEPHWEQLRPVLDAAIDELPEADRAAVVLRFLERRPFAEIGRALQVTEDAARVRTDRALDKLREALARHGITSTSAALGAAVLGQPLVSAPAGLAAAVAAQGAAGAAGFLSMLMSTKIITTVALFAALAFGAGNYLGRQHESTASVAAPAGTDQTKRLNALRQDNRQLSDEIAGLSAENAQLKEANAKLTARASASAAAQGAARKSPNLGVMKWELQRGILTNLKQLNAARDQYALEHGHPPDSVEQLVGRKSFIRALRTVGGEEYVGVSLEPGAPLTVTTPDGEMVTYGPAGNLTTKIEVPPEVAKFEELGAKIQGSIKRASSAYSAAHNGAAPPNANALIPYFATPQEGADFVEYVEARKSAGP